MIVWLKIVVAALNLAFAIAILVHVFVSDLDTWNTLIALGAACGWASVSHSLKEER